MSDYGSDKELADLLHKGYAAPPPDADFADGLLERLRGQLSESRGEAAAPTRPASAPAKAGSRTIPHYWGWAAATAAVVLAVGLAAVALNQGGGPRDNPAVLPEEGVSPFVPQAEGTPGETKVPLKVDLPKRQFIGTPINLMPGPYREKYDDKDRQPFMVPEGTVNLSRGKPVTSSDPIPVHGELAQITDGAKEGKDDYWVDLGPGRQWVQIDLRQPCEIYAILVWHRHDQARVYHDVVVQASDDPDFIENVRTLFNNDYDNSSGLGIGKDLEYVDDFRGRLIDAKGVRGRYVRLYCNGNTSDDLSHYTEVEVYGRPWGAPPAAP